MTVTVTYTCDGCSVAEEGMEPLRKSFCSVSGRSWGLGSAAAVNTVESIKPDGWWAFDPYTYLCYCPKCRVKIEESG